jgi:lipopolysaccharide/colanic/teichoic acid biosynthesis glycosyltransferase
MSIQLQAEPSVISQLPFEYGLRGNGLHPDGTLRIDYFFNREAVSRAKRNRRSREIWDHLIRDFLIAPVFLTMVLFVILFVPKKILKLRSILPSYLAQLAKRSFDIVGAVLGILLSSGFFFWLPLLIRLESKGKAIFRQRRIGQDRRRGDRRMVNLAVPFERRKSDRREENLMGKPFNVYKFRSMKENAEDGTGPIWAKTDDPRMTRLGRFLRPSHLDEIPQFVNVLKGEMSLVGPRPERLEFICDLNKEIPYYRKRLDCKPGITGLAQISCGYDSDLGDVVKKLDYDLYYIGNRSLLFDIRILLSTLKVVVSPANHRNGNGQLPGKTGIDSSAIVPSGKYAINDPKMNS